MDADAALAANSTGRWLLAAGVAVAVTLLLFTLRGLIASRLKKFAGRTSNEWDDTVSEVVAATRGLTIAVAGIVAGTMVLALDATALNVVSHALVLALLLQAGFWGTALAKSLISRWRRTRLPGDPAAASTLGIVTFGSYLLVWAAVVLLMLDNVGVNITALVAGLGIGGVAVALAMQNILGDLFGSLAIVLDKPFVVGDFINVGDMLGSVEYIGLKTTRIRSLSGEQLVFSNVDLLTSRIRNYGRMFERRVEFRLYTPLWTTRDQIHQVPAIIRNAVESHEAVRFDRCHLQSIGTASLVFETIWFVTSPDYNKYMDLQQDIYLQIHAEFEAAGIEFAHPTQRILLGPDDRTEADLRPRSPSSD